MKRNMENFKLSYKNFSLHIAINYLIQVDTREVSFPGWGKKPSSIIISLWERFSNLVSQERGKSLESPGWNAVYREETGFKAWQLTGAMSRKKWT